MKMSLASIDASVLWLLVIPVAISIPLWWHGHWRRTVAVTFSAASLLLVVGIPAWRDALASVATTPKALAGAGIVFGLSAAFFGIHIHSARKPKEAKLDPKGNVIEPAEEINDLYHHRWTVLLGIFAGSAGGLVVLDIANVVRNLSKAPGGVASAWSVASKAVTTGTAAQAAHGSSVSPYVVLGIGAVVFLVICRLMGRHPQVRAASAGRLTRREARAVAGSRRPEAIAAGSAVPGAPQMPRAGAPATSGPPARLGGK